MIEPLTWDNLNDALLQEFPILKTSPYAEKIGGFEGWSPGQYVVFGSLFNQYLRDLAQATDDARKAPGKFLERMATSNNGNIEDLLNIEVLPTLLEDQTIAEAYWPCLGEKTRGMLALIAPQKAPTISLPVRK